MTEFKVDNDKLVDVIIPEAMSQREFESLDHDDQIDEILEPKNVTENYLDGIRNGVERVISKGVPLPMPMEDLELIIRNLEITKAELSKLINKHPNSKILLHQLVNRAVVLGSLVGAQRGRVIFDDHIKRAENNKSSTQRGGEIRSENKKKEMAEVIEKIKAEANRIWSARPSATLDEVAGKINDNPKLSSIPRIPTKKDPSQAKDIRTSTIIEWIRDLNPNSRKNKDSLASKTDQSS